jgi:hypothetical protein
MKGIDAYVHLPGDSEVGIDGITIEVRGLPDFDDDEQRAEAREILRDAFERIGGWGAPSVQFSDDPPEPEPVFGDAPEGGR